MLNTNYAFFQHLNLCSENWQNLATEDEIWIQCTTVHMNLRVCSRIQWSFEVFELSHDGNYKISFISKWKKTQTGLSIYGEIHLKMMPLTEDDIKCLTEIKLLICMCDQTKIYHNICSWHFISRNFVLKIILLLSLFTSFCENIQTIRPFMSDLCDQPARSTSGEFIYSCFHILFCGIW